MVSILVWKSIWTILVWCQKYHIHKQKTAARDKDLKIALTPILVYSLAFILSS